MQATIARLMTVADTLRDIRNHETGAPRLFRDYLEMVPMTEIHELEASHKAEVESLETDHKEARDEQEKAEDALTDLQKFLDEEIEERDATISNLQAKLKTLSERSDIPTAPRVADDATIMAFTTSLCEERARVRTLEAQLAAALGDITGTRPAMPAAVKPLDTPPRKAAAITPAKPEKTKVPVPMATERPIISRNEERNGIELRFNGKPDDATRLAMKARKWRWCPGQPGQPWAHKYDEEEWIFANSLATGSAFTPMPETPEPAPEPAATPEPAAEARPFRPTIHFPTMPPAATAAPARRRIILPGF